MDKPQIDFRNMTDAEFDQHLAAASERGRNATISEARATAARYDEASGLVVVTLRGGAVLSVPAKLLQGVAGGTAAQIGAVEVMPPGDGLHWEELDADLTVQNIAAGSFGSRRWMQQLDEAGLLDTASQERQRLITERDGPLTPAAMGRKGGSATTARKAAASAANGRKGGRPKGTRDAKPRERRPKVAA